MTGQLPCDPIRSGSPRVVRRSPEDTACVRSLYLLAKRHAADYSEKAGEYPAAEWWRIGQSPGRGWRADVIAGISGRCCFHDPEWVRNNVIRRCFARIRRQDPGPLIPPEK